MFLLVLFFFLFLRACLFGTVAYVQTPDNLVSELARRVDRYVLASHLTWALWAIIQNKTSEIEVGAHRSLW